MAIRLKLSALAFSLLIISESHAQLSDFEWIEPGSFHHQQHQLNIKHEDGFHYSLTISSSFRLSIIDKPHNRIRTTTVHEDPYGAISKLKALHNKKALKKNQDIFVLDASRHDEFLTDSRIYSILWPENLAVGDNLSINFTEHYRDIKYFPPLFLYNADSIAEYSLYLKYPKEIAVEIEIFFPGGGLPYQLTDTVGGKMLRFNYLTRVEEKPCFPFNDLLAVILCRATAGDTLLNLPTPESFTRWYCDILNSIPSLPDELTDTLIRGLDATSTNIEKLKIINDFVHKKVRYYSDLREDHAIFPHAPSFVLEKMYGDCKDRAFLARSLAAKEGIKVELALVSSRYRPETALIHFGFFDHVLCVYQDAADTLFFDPTAKNIPFGYLPDFLYGKEALVLDREDPRFVRISFPQLLPALEVAVSLNPDVPDSSWATVSLRNTLGASALAAMAELQPLPKENFLSALTSERLVGITLNDFQLIDSGDNEVRFRTGADISNFLNAAPGKFILPQNGLIIADNKVFKRESDTLSLYFDSPELTVLTLNIRSRDYLSPPDSFILAASDSCTYRTSVATDDSGYLNIRYELRRLYSILNGEGKQAYIDFCRRYLSNKANIYILRRRQL